MYKNSVYKSLILITQIGISVLIPIFLFIWISDIIKEKYGINLILVFILLGLLVGIRNAIKLISNFLKYDKNSV